MLLLRKRKRIRYALCMYAYRGSLSWTVLSEGIYSYSSVLAVKQLRICTCEIQLAEILVLFLAVLYMPQGVVKNKYCTDVFWMSIVVLILF